MLSLRNGPGAAILPPTLTRIHLTFANNITGHVGPKYASPPPTRPSYTPQGHTRPLTPAKLTPSRKFWTECLRRLKFHNPAIPMIINRTAAEDAPATLTLYFRNSAVLTKPSNAPEKSFQPPSSLQGESPAQPASWDEKVVEIDVKGKHEDEILEAVVKHTEADVLEIPAEDKEALSKFAAQDKVSAVKSREARKVLDVERKAMAMLQRAKAGAE
ncbi:hypothetical protein IMZ48_39980 [Candidatus Bathyarchaeota archaeon]|nr:hypothetical protein [Candidatus Bathyarchaeota archaeon]